MRNATKGGMRISTSTKPGRGPADMPATTRRFCGGCAPRRRHAIAARPSEAGASSAAAYGQPILRHVQFSSNPGGVRPCSTISARIRIDTSPRVHGRTLGQAGANSIAKDHARSRKVLTDVKKEPGRLTFSGRSVRPEARRTALQIFGHSAAGSMSGRGSSSFGACWSASAALNPRRRSKYKSCTWRSAPGVAQTLAATRSMSCRGVLAPAASASVMVMPNAFSVSKTNSRPSNPI